MARGAARGRRLSGRLRLVLVLRGGSAAGRTGRVARAFGPFGGGGDDVPEHAAEHDAVKRRNGPLVSMTCEPLRPEDRPLAVGGLPVIVLAHRHLQPGQARQLHRRAQPTRDDSSSCRIAGIADFSFMPTAAILSM